MLPRVLEPEVMDSPEEARDYDAMDHREVNSSFCDDFLDFLGRNGVSFPASPSRTLIDFGTGTALIPVELCGRTSGLSIVGIDLAHSMLALGKSNISRARLNDRVQLHLYEGKKTPYADGAFDFVISNSVAHHIPEPQDLLAEMWRVTRRGGVLFVRDLERPSSLAEVELLVEKHSGAAPLPPEHVQSYERQRELFRASLCAALTIPELLDRIRPFGIPASAVSRTSDRHWTLAYEKA